MTSRITVRDGDGNPVDLDALRPSSHSASLDGAVKRMLSARDAYRAAVQREEARVNFTPDGALDMRRGHARAALNELRLAYQQARQQAAAELSSASDRFTNALAKNAPMLDAAGAIIAVELGKRLVADPRLRQRLLLLARGEADDWEFQDAELMRAAVRLPLALSGFQAGEVAAMKAALAPDEAAALARARQAESYTVELAADVAKSVLTDAKLGPHVLDHELGEAVQAQSLRPLNIQRADEGTVEQPAQPGAVEQPAEAAETVTEA